MITEQLGKIFGICVFALLLSGFTAHGFGDVINGGFEDDDTSGGDVAGASGWSVLNDVFSSSQSATPFEGVNVVKMFGPFNSTPEAANVHQSLAATAGQVWLASAQAQNWGGDAMLGDTFGSVLLEFFDGGGSVIGSALESARVDANTTADVWNLLTISGTAPTGTATAKITLQHVQPTGGNFGGSVFFDDAHLTFTGVPEPGSMTLLMLGGLGLFARRRR